MVCKHTCLRECGEQLWLCGSGGSFKRHMQAMTKHENCSPDCLGNVYLGRRQEKKIPSPTQGPSSSDSTFSPSVSTSDTPVSTSRETVPSQGRYRILVVFDIEKRTYARFDLEHKQTSWTTVYMPLSEARFITENEAIKGFAHSNLRRGTDGLVLVQIYDRVHEFFPLINTMLTFIPATVHPFFI